MAYTARRPPTTRAAASRTFAIRDFIPSSTDKDRLAVHVEQNLPVQRDAALAALDREALGETAKFLRADFNNLLWRRASLVHQRAVHPAIPALVEGPVV